MGYITSCKYTYMIKTIGAHLKVANFQKSLKFYQALGFKKVFEYGPKKKVKEIYNGAVFEHGGTKLEIAEGHRAVKPEVFLQPITSAKVSLMVGVNSLTDIINRAKKAHIRIAVNARHYYWGTLELVIKDPDGLVLVFIAPYSKAAATKLKADETFSQQATSP